MKNLYQVIKKPIITEKSTAAVAENKYTFAVDKKASKGEIKEAVETLFEVTVLEVRTANVSGKEVRGGRGRRPTKRPDWKKAVVTVKEGEKIELFET